MRQGVGIERGMKMKKMLVLVSCMALLGCDYMVPLVEKPEIDIDRAALGLWRRTKDGGESEQLLVLPLGKKEYLISYPAGSKDAMFARGCLWRCEGLTLIQLDWIGTARGKLADNKRTFQYAAYVVERGSLRIRMLNVDIIDNKISSSAALAKEIASKVEEPELLIDEKVFWKSED